jgi:hypothetical protein
MASEAAAAPPPSECLGDTQPPWPGFHMCTSTLVSSDSVMVPDRSASKIVKQTDGGQVVGQEGKREG